METVQIACRSIHLAAIVLGALVSFSPVRGQAPAGPAAPSSGTTRSPGGIVAIANQDVITRGELNRRVNLQIEETRLSGIDATTLERDRPRIERAILDHMIDQRLLLQEAKKQGITTSDPEIDAEINRKILEFFPRRGLVVQDAEGLYKVLKENYGYSREDYRAQVRDEILINRLLWTKHFTVRFVPPGEMREYYLAHEAEFMAPGLVSFRMISVDRTEEAQRILEALDAALEKQPFEVVAREFSLAKGGTGDDNFFKNKPLSDLKDWNRPLPDVLSRMRKGEVMKRIQTVRGWRYIEMVDVVPGIKQSFEDAEEEIRDAIRRRNNSREQIRLLARLRREAHIQVNLPPVAPLPARAPPPAAADGPPIKPKDVSPDPTKPKAVPRESKAEQER